MQQADILHALVIHTDPVVAAGLHTILRLQPGFFVTAVPTACAWLANGQREDVGVDVVVADYQSGLDLLAAAKLASRAGATRAPSIVLVSQLAREWEIRQAINAGVMGYVLQNCSADEIVVGVRLAGAGRHYLCHAVAERIAESLSRVTLTAREGDVLELLRHGLCNKTIARDLGIAPGTVKAHVKGILEKLESNTRTQAVAVATHRGLIATGASRQVPLGEQVRRKPSAQAAAFLAPQRAEYA